MGELPVCVMFRGVPERGHVSVCCAQPVDAKETLVLLCLAATQVLSLMSRAFVPVRKFAVKDVQFVGMQSGRRACSLCTC